MNSRDCLAAAAALLGIGLADPAAAMTPRHHRTHVFHRRHRVEIIRSGYVTTAYVPSARLAPRIAGRETPRVVRAQPPGPPATAASDMQALWSNDRTPVATVAPARPRVRATETETRIPEDRFAVLFGPERPFRLSLLPARASGSYGEFENSGYGFTLLDPVPRSWSSDWYDKDAITIVEQKGGYFLVDLSHPADPLALRVTALAD